MSPSMLLRAFFFLALLSLPCSAYGQDLSQETAKYFPPRQKKSALCFRRVVAETVTIPPSFYLETFRARENRFVIESNSGSGEMFKTDEWGRPVLMASLIPNGRTQLVYDPPLVMFPTTLQPKQVFESESFVRVNSMSGAILTRITRRVQLLKVEDLKLWTSLFKDCLKVKVTMTYYPEDPRKPQAQVEEICWLAQGRGIICRKGTVRLKKPGSKKFTISHRVHDEDVQINLGNIAHFAQHLIKESIIYKDQEAKAGEILKRLLDALSQNKRSDANAVLWELNQCLLVASVRKRFQEEKNPAPSKKPSPKAKAKARLY
ncbi:MAG: hypothetical protein P1V97_00225 [Planctomycetota bacterium]|nr:hypothetical protein [Planctomycetota bacterium]